MFTLWVTIGAIIGGFALASGVWAKPSADQDQLSSPRLVIDKTLLAADDDDDWIDDDFYPGIEEPDCRRNVRVVARFTKSGTKNAVSSEGLRSSLISVRF